LHSFLRSGDPADIDRTISASERVVNLTPNGHADEPAYLNNLGNAFLRRFENSGDLADSHRVISSYRSAGNCLTGAASKRLKAALNWARLPASRIDPSSTLQGYTKALNLVSQTAWLGQSLTARHRELLSIGAIASEAAAAVSAAEQYETALEWLEQGRSIVWNQLLSLRTPVDALRQVDPTLANDLERVSITLEHASTGDSSMHDLSHQSDQQLSSMEESAQHHRRLAEEWEHLGGRVRDIPGFESFLRPKKFTQLCTFSYAKAEELHLHLNQLLSTACVRVRDTDIRAVKRATTFTHGGFEFILSTLWLCIVKPVLDSLAVTVSHLLIN
jgi:hypothetical protein